MTMPRKKANQFPYSKRSAASRALVSLRKAMGMTQAQFAVKVMRVAVTTVARYETSHSPAGELLLKLSQAAVNAERPVEARIFSEAWHLGNKATWDKYRAGNGRGQ